MAFKPKEKPKPKPKPAVEKQPELDADEVRRAKLRRQGLR